jgi:LPXTG-site transpeptidase (sortase) family protein
MLQAELLRKVRFTCAVLFLNLFSVAFFWNSALPFRSTPSATAATAPYSIPRLPAPTIQSTIVSGKPVHISIPKLDRQLTIVDGVYDTGANAWSLTETNAHFATITAPLSNQSGNTLIYGHRNKLVFGDLYLLKPGDTVNIRSDIGKTFTYEFVSAHDVAPDDTTILAAPPGGPTLTLQTCSGVWNEMRRLSHFRLQHVDI